MTPGFLAPYNPHCLIGLEAVLLGLLRLTSPACSQVSANAWLSLRPVQGFCCSTIPEQVLKIPGFSISYLQPAHHVFLRLDVIEQHINDSFSSSQAI